MNTKPMLTAVAAALFSLGACVSAQAADLSTCTTCHSNITKAHAGAAHKDIACTSCHSGVDQHLKKVTDRPTVNMDPATCGGCHQAQYKSLYKDDGRAARQSKKAPNGPAPDPFFDRALGETCRTLGYDEIITYSFISPSYYDKIRMPKDSPLRKSLKILNPLGEDTSIMRTTILPSMLEIITRNYNFRNKAVRLYELGKIYLPREDGLADEPKILSLGAYGDGMDFFTLKGGIEAILRACRIKDVRFEACTDNASYHPGRCAKVYAGDVELGVFGQIHPLVAATYGVDAEIYAAELRFDALYSVRGGIPVYRPLPKFPAVTRDIAVVCAESVTVGALEDCIRRGAKGLLKKVELFDIYRGIGVAPGSKSVAFSLTLRADDRSLTGEEADEDVKSILALLEAELGAKLR